MDSRTVRQQKKDTTAVNGVNTTNAFLDDTMIVTIGNTEKYDEKIEKTLKRLDEENLAINLHKCE